jgi:hypothetical protein
MAYPINNNLTWGISDSTSGQIPIWSNNVLTGYTFTSDHWVDMAPTTEEILDKLDIRDIETYLRKKKINRIKKRV